MDKKILKEYLLNGLTTRDIEKITGLNHRTVCYWVNKYNLNDCYKYKKVEYINDRMFNKIDTKEKAYIIGYFVADGYISEKSIEFGCAIKDSEIIEFIQSCIGGNVRYDNSFNKERRRFPRARMSIGNKNLITDFYKHCSSKSEKRLPVIKKELERYLVQGYFDGNGCVTWGFRKDRNRLWHKISFCGQLKELQGIQNILIKQCGISSAIRPKGKSKCYVLDFANKKDVKTFLNYIYPDNSFIILKRKFNRANALRLELGEFGEDPRTPSEVA